MRALDPPRHSNGKPHTHNYIQQHPCECSIWNLRKSQGISDKILVRSTVSRFVILSILEIFYSTQLKIPDMTWINIKGRMVIGRLTRKLSTIWGNWRFKKDWMHLQLWVFTTLFGYKYHCVISNNWASKKILNLKRFFHCAYLQSASHYDNKEASWWHLWKFESILSFRSKISSLSLEDGGVDTNVIESWQYKMGQLTDFIPLLAF